MASHLAERLDAASIDDLRELPELHITDENPQADNNARATFAAVALVAYVARVGDAGDWDASISDLLADLMHLCDALDTDFDALVARAGRNYDDEILGS